MWSTSTRYKEEDHIKNLSEPSRKQKHNFASLTNFKLKKTVFWTFLVLTAGYLWFRLFYKWSNYFARK